MNESSHCTPIFVTCPHCNAMIEVLQINCGIFRHGVYKSSNRQINPHETKEVCDKLFVNELIYGCGKPFRLLMENNEYSTVTCDYI